MAHIAVQLQRTPHGLHPASAVALCWARDIASNRGATVTALCFGDAGESDANIVAAASRFGADVILFGGPNGLQNLCERLNPVHVLVPFTHEGLTAATALGRGDAVARWIDRRSPPYATADAFTAVVAGVKPWHHFDAQLDPEYEGDVDGVRVPAFNKPAEGNAAPPVFDLGGAPLGYLAPEGLDPVVASALEGLGATATAWDDAPHRRGGTTLVLPDALDPSGAADAGSDLPEMAGGRTDAGRIIVLPGPVPQGHTVPERWKHADWVLPGLWADVIASLREGPWTPAPQ
ncbi:MAG: hypothetical protein ACE37F_25890 [Nannocystaceae bacterium]|nr:hypothetical protein [bacterium]